MLNRLKNIPWRFLGFLSLGLLALVGVGLLMSLVKKKDQSQLCSDMKIIVEGKETFIDQTEIEKIVKKQYGIVIGRPLNDIPLEKIEKSLKDLPYVSEATVFVDMDGVMKINVQQRAILLRVINNLGQDFYVDLQGKKIPTTLKYVPYVMVASGYIRESYAKPLDEVESDVVKDLMEIVSYVSNHDVWRNQVVQLYVNSSGDIEIVPRVGNQAIILGNGEHLEDKLNRVETFYKQILPKVGIDAYAKVNVKYLEQIICEKKGEWDIDALPQSIN